MLGAAHHRGFIVLTEEKEFNLRANKYQEVPYPDADTKMFIKTIQDDVGKKYYIELKAYKWPGTTSVTFEADVYFERKGLTFTTKLHHVEAMPLIEVEAFYEALWRAMGCDYYRKGTEATWNED